MKQLLFVTILLCATTGLAFGQANNKAAQELDKVTETFRAAYLRRDAEALASMLADDFLIVSSPYNQGMDKTQFLAGLKRPMSSPQKWEAYEYSETVRHYYGDTAVAFMVATLKGINPNNEPYTSRSRLTATSIKQQGRWQIAAIHMTPIPIERVAAKVDPKVYDAYVGQYQFPGAVVTVSREGDKLFWQAAGAVKNELIPANETTFYLKDSLTQNVMVKDETGKVTHVKQILSDGRAASFKKIK
jgi:ketosteroid isomerase-like protein